MFRSGLVLAAVAGLWASAAGAAAPLDVYGKLPSIEDLAISPDGARLASILTDGEQRTIHIANLADRKLDRVLQVSDAKLRAVFWAGPDHLIILKSTTASIIGVQSPRQEYLLAFDYNLKTARARVLLNDANNSLNAIYAEPDLRMIGGKPVLFLQGVHFVNSQGVLSLFRVELDHDGSTLAEEGGPDTNGWVMGADGTAVAQSLWNSKTGRWSMKTRVGDFWHETRVQQAPSEPPFLVGLGRDGRSVAVEELLDGAGVVREVAADGKWSDPLEIKEDERPVFDPVRHNLIGYSALIGEEERYSFFDPRDAEVWRLVLKAYPNQRVGLVSWSDDRRKIVVRADSPEFGPGYALVDLNTHHADWIGNQYDKLAPEDISPVRTVSFKAKDGLALSGYLTLPRGKVVKDLPLVVFPHGGPAVRDGPGFDWWAQAMASRGYAVLQVNFRGSNGFGWDFLKAGFGQWGRKMQTDLSDGVRYFVGEGIVDPKRVCIVGASYGGYAAMAGPTLDPGVYRCAAAYAGISDMHSFTPWVRSQDGEGSERYVIRFLGAESAKDPSLSEISPAAHVDKVTVPMLLIHGKDDTVVPLLQSRIMAQALKAAGKPVDLVILDSTDHWLTRGETRLAMLKAVVAFLEKNNPPD
jgi:dipeptidyl aminopeptidase/acylaminoacyl peptidase